MHGRNPIRVQDLSKPRQLAVEKIFYTIQGEGPFCGIPAVFVRLSGCWLACYWCDTQFEEGISTAYDPQGILAKVQKEHGKAPCDLVVLTGGDPLRQNIALLCDTLVQAGYHVQIETAGVKWVPGLEILCRGARDRSPGVSIVVSPKTGKVDPNVAIHAVAWKYIVDADDEWSLEDGLPISSTQKPGLRQPLARPSHVPPDHVYLQPCDKEDEDHNRRNRSLVSYLSMKFGYRVSLQQHKILGVE